MSDTDQTDPTPDDDATAPSNSAGAPPTGDPDPEAGADSDNATFTPEYVRGLRAEAKANRQRATEAEGALSGALGQLWAERVKASGRLINPEDLPAPAEISAETITEEAVAEAIDALLATRPYLGSRAMPNIGQNQDPADADAVSISGLMRGNA